MPRGGGDGSGTQGRPPSHRGCLGVRDYHTGVLPSVVPQLVANDATRGLPRAIADPDRFACEPKVDGVRGLVALSAVGMTMSRPGLARSDLGFAIAL
jgi:hypothetical protein